MEASTALEPFATFVMEIRSRRMSDQLTTTKRLIGSRVVDAKRGKRIGKVSRFVFHPTERRVIGFTVKRPDAALMFHRKDLFVALGGYDVVDDQVVVRDESSAVGKDALKALEVDWDECVIWIGMPVTTTSGKHLGYVDVVAFDANTGAVRELTIENGVANDAILGKRTIPGKLVKGFRRGKGELLALMESRSGDDSLGLSESGAILVADAAEAIDAEGGAAAAAGKATAVVTDKAKKGAERAKVALDARAKKAKPIAQEATRKTGKAVEAGAFAAGKQLGKASGMFAAFKEEFDKAARGESGDD